MGGGMGRGMGGGMGGDNSERQQSQVSIPKNVS